MPALHRREMDEDVGEPVPLEGLWSPVDDARALVEDDFSGLVRIDR